MINSFRISEENLLGGGLEPPCLAACAPQTHVSAISPPELKNEKFRTSLTQCKREIWGNALAA